MKGSQSLLVHFLKCDLKLGFLLRIGSWKMDLCPQAPPASVCVPWGTLPLRDSHLKFLPHPVLCPSASRYNEWGDSREKPRGGGRSAGDGWPRGPSPSPDSEISMRQEGGKSLLLSRPRVPISAESYFNSRALSKR